MKLIMVLFLIWGNSSLAEENKSKTFVVKAITEVFFQHNIEKVDQYFSKNYIQHQPGLANGLDPFKKYLGALFKAFPDYRGEIENIVTEGDLVSIHIAWTGTHKAELMGAPATGKTIKRRTADILKVSNGLITEHWGVVDQLDMLKDLGIYTATSKPVH